MTTKQNLISKLSDIQESVSFLTKTERENFLEDVSFNYGYIQLALQDHRLDSLLQKAIAYSFSDVHVYDYLQDMIDILS